jgi:hypothetical protein
MYSSSRIGPSATLAALKKRKLLILGSGGYALSKRGSRIAAKLPQA